MHLKLSIPFLSAVVLHIAAEKFANEGYRKMRINKRCGNASAAHNQKM